MKLCAACETPTDPLTEHRSEVEPPLVFHPECCWGGCDEGCPEHQR